ncbi:MAG: fibronectin type III domain-containing protein, partial [Bacteroidales bacterium]|nr:fibronectin type III domain-containing protein [Bacteroidales bacterium]
MKKVLSILLTLMLGLASWQLSAQQIVEILGDAGTTTNSYLPLYSFYNNTLSEQIYTSNEVGMAGSISAISFFNGGSAKSPNLKIYMVNTDKTEFTNSTDWLTVVATDKVFEGTVTLTAGAWTTIQFNTPFVYDGVSNLGLIVDANLSYSSGLACRVFSSTSNCSMYDYDDNIDYDPMGATYTADSRLSVKNQIKLTITPANLNCNPPGPLSVSNVLSNDATIAWTIPVDLGTYILQYKTSSEDWDGPNVVTDFPSDSVYNFSGMLNPNTTYNVRVANMCSNGDTSMWRSTTFTTTNVAVQLPYIQDFETSPESITDFTISNNGPNGWYIGSATGMASGDPAVHSLYISNNNGASNSYTNTSASDAYAYIDVVFDNNPMEWHLSFDYNVNGEGTSYKYDYLSVYLVDGSTTIPSSGAPNGAALLYQSNLLSDWTHFDAILENVVGTSKRIVFYWRNDGSSGTNPPAAVDNISVVGYTCGKPSNIQLTGSTSSSLSVSWTENGTATSWSVFYRVHGTTDAYTEVPVSGQPVADIINLNADTRYDIYVVAHCDDGSDSQESNIASFRTQCGPLTQLPYFNNFDDVIEDNGTNFITCWSRLTTLPERVVRCYGANTHSGAYSLDFNYSPSCTTAVVTPMLDPSIPLNTVMVDFWAISGLAEGWMEVGTMSDPSDFSTYEFYDTVRLSAPSTWENLMISFENYNGTNQYIAFLEINGTSTSYIFDDFTINYIPVCLHPTNLAVDSLASDAVTLSWVEAGTANTWTIEYGPAGFTLGNGTAVSATENPFTIGNLAGGTTYDFYVYSECGSDLSDPFGPVSATPGQYTMQATGSDTLVTCGMAIYDDGGPSGNYSNNCNTTLVLYPETPGSTLMITGTVNVENSYEHLYIYDGVGTSGSLLGEYTGSQTVNVIASNGPLTIKFTSDVSVNSYSGYELFVHCISCIPPYGLQVSDIMTNSANLTWGGSGDSYLVYLYGADTTVTSVMDTTFALTTLDVNSTYTVAVQSICGADTSFMSSPVTFTTPTVPATLPYTTDFEDDSDNIQWGILNGTQTNKWYIGAPTDAASDVNTTPGGINGMYVSNNGGASNTYTGSESRVYAFRDILVPDGTTELMLSFDWKAMGGSAANEFLRVYWIDPAVVPVNAGSNPPSVGGVNYDLYAMPGYTTTGSHWLSQENTWQHEEMLISATQFAGMGNGDHIYRLYFHWRNTSYSVNPPAAVDNISLAAVECATPLNVTVSDIGENTATVSWSGSADYFGVTVLAAGGSPDVQTTTDTSLVLSGLTANTVYQVAVRGYCGADSSVISQGVQFTTACGAISSLPFYADFNTYSSMDGSNFVNCWSRHASDPTNHWVYVASGSDSYDGGYLDFHYTPNCYTMAITPMFDPSIALNTLMIEGMTRIHLNGTAGVFEIGTVSDPADPTTFTPYDTLEYTASFSWLPFSILMNNYTGNDHYIAFRAMNGIDVSYLLDNITIDVVPSCYHPASLSLSNVTSDGATISWNGTSANYVIEYGPAGFTPGTGTTVNVTGAMTYTLTGLDPATSYTVYVHSDCGSAGLSEASSINFKTTCATTSVPYSENFDSYVTSSDFTDTHGIAPDCWTTYSANTSYGAPHITSTGSYHYTHSGSNCMVFTCSSNGANAYAALPSFDQPLNTLKVNFWRAMESTSSGELTVGYVTDLNNLQGSFVQVATIPSVSSSSGDTITVDFSNVNIANGNICFHWYKDGTYYSCCIDDINVTLSSGGGPVITNPTVATNAANPVAQTTATLNATITNPDQVTISAKGFEWKTTVGGNFTPVAGAGTGNTFTANLTNLTPNTSYTFKAFITYNGTTTYGDEMTFTTEEQQQETCPAPTNLTATVDHTDVTLTWQQEPNTATEWQINYRLATESNWSTVTATSTTYTLTDLTANAQYVANVVAHCTNGLTSDESNTVT